jgi:hypothetical protein
VKYFSSIGLVSAWMNGRDEWWYGIDMLVKFS